MAIQALPQTEEWGWKYDSGKLIPDWTDLPEASSAVLDLIKCSTTKRKVVMDYVNVVMSCFLVLKRICAKGRVSEMIEVNEHEQ